VVTLYLLTQLNLTVRPKLMKELKPARASWRMHSIWATGNREKTESIGTSSIYFGGFRMNVTDSVVSAHKSATPLAGKV
jgi:hypothetical protein